MIQKTFLILLVLTIITSCSQSDSYDITDSFPFAECTSFVIYAGKSFEDNPDKTFPSLIHHAYDVDNSGITADVAPYLTVLESGDMLESIIKWKDTPANNLDFEQAVETEEWVKRRMKEGWTHFMYETEPKKYAGNAYPWAFHAEGQ